MISLMKQYKDQMINPNYSVYPKENDYVEEPQCKQLLTLNMNFL